MIYDDPGKPKKTKKKKPKKTPVIPAASACRPLLHSVADGVSEIRRKESLECRLGEMATESVACVHNASTGASTRYPTDMISALTRLQGPIALSEKGPKKDGQLRRRR